MAPPTYYSVKKSHWAPSCMNMKSEVETDESDGLLVWNGTKTSVLRKKEVY